MGKILIVYPSRVEQEFECKKPPSDKELNQWVGGPYNICPIYLNWDKIDDTAHKTVLVFNENAKVFEEGINFAAMQYITAFAEWSQFVLYGTVAFLIGRDVHPVFKEDAFNPRGCLSTE